MTIWNEKPVALVTGGARGIGAGIALELAKNGYDVAIDDVCEKGKAVPVLDEMKVAGAKAIYIKGNISKSEDRDLILSSLKEKFGRVDILVNNAGIAPKVRADILEADEESFDLVMAVNLKGPYFLTKLIARWMIELKRKVDINPMIVNIASISSYTSSPSRGEYCISKAGVTMMTKLYADRLSEHGINVYEIRPGIILTPMTQVVKPKYDKLIAKGLTPIKRWGTPQDVARAVVAIAKGYFQFSTGEVFNIDGGFHLRSL